MLCTIRNYYPVGAAEKAVSMGIRRLGPKLVTGVYQRPFLMMGEAMKVIPRTLAQNCGVSVIRAVTQLRAKHAEVYDDDASSKGTTTMDEKKGERRRGRGEGRRRR